MTPNASVVPPNGHHFIEKNGDTEVRIDGQSYVEVAEKLLKYRAANGYPLGEPLEEIYAYVCTTWPHFCNNNPRIDPRTDGEAPLTIKMIGWLQDLWNRQALIPTPLVTSSEAQRRADICKACPKQQSWADYGCGTCVDTVARKSLVFRAGKEVIGAKHLHGCSILGQENHTACWASKSVLPDTTPEQRQLLPAQCWRK